MFIIIPIPRFGKKKGRRAPAGLLYVAAAIFVIGGITMSMSKASEPSCGGAALHAGQQCRYEDGSVDTYEQKKSSQHQDDTWLTVMLLGGGTVCLVLAMVRGMGEKDKREQLARARAAHVAQQASQDAGPRPYEPFVPLDLSGVIGHSSGPPLRPADSSPGFGGIDDLFPPLPPSGR